MIGIVRNDQTEVQRVDIKSCSSMHGIWDSYVDICALEDMGIPTLPFLITVAHITSQTSSIACLYLPLGVSHSPSISKLMTSNIMTSNMAFPLFHLHSFTQQTLKTSTEGHTIWPSVCLHIQYNTSGLTQPFIIYAYKTIPWEGGGQQIVLPLRLSLAPLDHSFISFCVVNLEKHFPKVAFKEKGTPFSFTLRSLGLLSYKFRCYKQEPLIDPVHKSPSSWSSAGPDIPFKFVPYFQACNFGATFNLFEILFSLLDKLHIFFLYNLLFFFTMDLDVHSEK